MKTPSKILYRAQVTARGGRDGHVISSDSILDLAVATPKEMGGPGGQATNPEQLFAAGYAACFLSALKYVGSVEKTPIPQTAEVQGNVGIGPTDGGFALEVELKVSLPGIEHEKAQALVEKAHQVCPYSNATRDNIKVTLSIA